MEKKSIKLLAIFILLQFFVFKSPVLAKMYKWIDENGNTVYSNGVPPQNAEIVSAKNEKNERSSPQRHSGMSGPEDSNRFQDNKDLTVADTLTGLMLQKRPSKNRLVWSAANEYCNSLELADYSDWRLPTKDELKGLVLCTNGHPTPLKDFRESKDDYTCEGGGYGGSPRVHKNADGSYGTEPRDYKTPTIDEIFTVTKGDYWTSTPDNHFMAGDNYYFVSFLHGMSNSMANVNKAYILCVRN